MRHFNGPYDLLEAGFSSQAFLVRSSQGDVEVRAPQPPFPVLARVNPDAATAVFVPAGGRFLTGTSEGFLDLWDPAMARGTLDSITHIYNLPNTAVPKGTHGDRVTAVACSPDGRLAASGSDDTYARLWDLRTGARAGPELPHDAPVTRIAFSPDGRRLATATEDGAVRLWSVASGEPLTLPYRCGVRLRSLHFATGGTILLAFSEEGTVLRILQ